jgi:hypothetical protein
VTPAGVRDGDPDALAGLCDRRGPAVIAYCEVVAGRDAAAAAAAEAFGSFRANVVAAGDLENVNPEALLINATRHAAAHRAGGDAPAPCARVPALLAARADRSITLADHDWLKEHLADCWTCRAPVARFEAADRAYRDPPTGSLEPEVAATIVAALAAAAPIRGGAEATEAVLGDGAGAPGEAASPNGSAARATPAGPDAEQADGRATYVDQPTAAYQIGDVDVEPDEPSPGAADVPPPEPTGRRAKVLGVFGLSRAGRPSRGSATAAGTVAAGSPPPSRVASAGAIARRRRPRPAVVLPIALVIIAIVVALLVAGVFGGGEPASVPHSFAPRPSTPTPTARPRVVVVPGAAASAAAVEREKARARAAKRRAAAGRRRPARSSAAALARRPATRPPAATRAPARAPARNESAASAPARKAPSRSSAPSGRAKVKINADNGATGAEQLPPARDTSTVPELAPPVEPAAPPPG